MKPNVCIRLVRDRKLKPTALLYFKLKVISYNLALNPY
ncbi:hypothetical protein RPMD05_19 [Rhodobacteraceae phage LS06-2018-MD05]|nr:hypothetical protein RPMD05_19 [Rhodobacteraceae phage LS06-2018-MD05]